MVADEECKVKESGMKEDKESEKATFAGGCFWCMEATFKELNGVINVVSGYTGGHVGNPSYGEVSRGNTGHYEAVQIEFDPEIMSFKELLDVFWRQIDPTDDGGQFADRGSQYKTAIFYHGEEQRVEAEISKKKLDESKKFEKPVLTEIKKFEEFFEAEEYHQNYYIENRERYKAYRFLSGRASFLKKVWGD